MENWTELNVEITLAEFSKFAELKIFADLLTQTLNFEKKMEILKPNYKLKKNYYLQHRIKIIATLVLNQRSLRFCYVWFSCGKSSHTKPQLFLYQHVAHNSGNHSNAINSGLKNLNFTKQNAEWIAPNFTQIRNENHVGLFSSFAELSCLWKTELCAEKTLAELSLKRNKNLTEFTQTLKIGKRNPVEY